MSPPAFLGGVFMDAAWYAFQGLSFLGPFTPALLALGVAVFFYMLTRL